MSFDEIAIMLSAKEESPNDGFEIKDSIAMVVNTVAKSWNYNGFSQSNNRGRGRGNNNRGGHGRGSNQHSQQYN